MYCPDCGNLTAEGKRFCVKCGSDLGSLPVSAPAGSSDVRTPATDGSSRSRSGSSLRVESIGEWATSAPANDAADISPERTPDTPSGRSGSIESAGEWTTSLSIGDSQSCRSGRVVAGRYEIREVLGTGILGTVYRVYDRDLREESALKLLHAHLMESASAVERFAMEASAARRLNHPGIVRVHHASRREGLHYLTMEVLEGRSLGAWITDLRREGRLAPVPVVLSIGSQVLDALSYAHRTIVHRDIKPENIFLLGQEGQFKVKLLDFGIVRVLNRDAAVAENARFETAWYMAPEQRAGVVKLDGRADLYSMAAVLYELLVGRSAQGVFPLPSEIRKGLASGWDDLLVRGALQADPAYRPSNAEEMSRRLARLWETRVVAPGHSAEGSVPSSAVLLQSSREGRASAQGVNGMRSHRMHRPKGVGLGHLACLANCGCSKCLASR